MKYAAIIGINPSKGARSPILWNRAFKYFDHEIRMKPIDVKEDKINDLFEKLNEDKDFIGGAIAFPYKEIIAKLLGNNLTKEAKKIGAVNCLYRNKDNQLFGTNTDGEAAVQSYKNNFGSIGKKKILIIGLGGAGKAVSTYFSYSSNKSIICASRKTKDLNFCKRIKSEWIQLNEINKVLNEVDIIVNCTSLGSIINLGMSPIDKSLIEKINKNTVIFDIIYDPNETELIKDAKKNNLKTLNGYEMNYIQAVLAFYKASPKPKDFENIKRSMMENGD